MMRNPQQEHDLRGAVVSRKKLRTGVVLLLRHYNDSHQRQSDQGHQNQSFQDSRVFVPRNGKQGVPQVGDYIRVNTALVGTSGEEKGSTIAVVSSWELLEQHLEDEGVHQKTRSLVLDLMQRKKHVVALDDKKQLCPALRKALIAEISRDNTSVDGVDCSAIVARTCMTTPKNNTTGTTIQQPKRCFLQWRHEIFERDWIALRQSASARRESLKVNAAARDLIPPEEADDTHTPFSSNKRTTTQKSPATTSTTESATPASPRKQSPPTKRIEDEHCEATSIDKTSKHRRASIFADWLVQTFFPQMNKLSIVPDQDEKQPLIVDVAGGAGDLAVALRERGFRQVYVIDPWKAEKWKPWQLRKVMNITPSKDEQDHRDNYASSSSLSSKTERLGAAAALLDSFFVKGKVEMPPRSSTRTADVDAQELLVDDVSSLLSRADLIVGLHPDQATEPLLAWARSLKTPVATVPCCVFSDLFPNRVLHAVEPEPEEEKSLLYCAEARRLADDDTTSTCAGQGQLEDRRSKKNPFSIRPVRDYGTFLTYLTSTYRGLASTVLPVDGKNIVLYTTKWSKRTEDHTDSPRRSYG
ncbi:unnamed protein product [Amoebophrya sp. A25]|nr:unnamed protein product [Amoebophrya sp. A25]|eukprot:GSA25T00008716001.1